MLMHAGTVLEVENVSKLFSRNTLESQKRLGDIVRAALWGGSVKVTRLQKKEFWALRDVSFTLKKGEAIGVIGLNGAGKTTLLRLLNGQFPPDRGEVRLAGRSASMIDLTAGFNNRMSGHENIYLRSAMLGKTRAKVDAHIQDIVDFTEIGDALAAPLSTYSSGMRMRLAFATTVFVDPDLLIIDEVLAVGDFQFRQKCLEKVRQLRDKCAFVFASHSMTDIARFCNKAIVMEKGRIAFAGEPDDAIQFFKQRDTNTVKQTAVKEKHENDLNKLGEAFLNPADITDVSVRWTNRDGQETATFLWGEKITIHLEFTVKYETERLNIGIPIWRMDDEKMISALSTEQRDYRLTPDPDGRCRTAVEFDTAALLPGTYESVTAIIDGPKFLYRQPNSEFTINADAAPRGWGQVFLPHEWSTEHKAS
ncbi:MAG: ABC transporter ATP-binding protein [Pseudomonadota bacterium]